MRCFIASVAMQLVRQPGWGLMGDPQRHVQAVPEWTSCP